MGIDSTNLPDAMLRRMRPEDRPSGNAGLTQAEADAKREQREERAIQQDIERDLMRRGIIVCRPRMDRKSTIRKGWPDLTFAYRGRFVALEVKTASGKLSHDQRDCIEALRSDLCGGVVAIVRSLRDVQSVLASIDAAPASKWMDMFKIGAGENDLTTSAD